MQLLALCYNERMNKSYQIIVIGAGAGGLVVAIGAAKAGKKVLLIERGNYGGDCTNFGCIPSKSLIASAHTAHQIQRAQEYGISLPDLSFNANNALQRTRDIVKGIRAHEEPLELAKLGVETLTGTAAFKDKNTLEVTKIDDSQVEVTAKSIVIATGSAPFLPPIPGLDKVPYLTNENIFDLQEIPKHLAVIGGGPIGAELAQAFSRLGAKVSVIELFPRLFSKEEPKVQDLMEKIFSDNGISLYLNHQTVSLQQDDKNILLKISTNETKQLSELSASHILLSVGRKPNIAKLNLEDANIQTNQRGIVVDKYGRTSQKNIYAIGDVTGDAAFTHMAENEARTVLANLLLPWPIKFKLDRKQYVPHVTYTDPEIAGFGLTRKQAEDKYGANKIATYHVPFSEVDRAITTGRTEGFVMVVTKKWSSKILGATIVAPTAGEMLAELSLAASAGIPLRKLARLIHAYPTYSLAIRKAADRWLTETIIPFFRNKKSR